MDKLLIQGQALEEALGESAMLHECISEMRSCRCNCNADAHDFGLNAVQVTYKTAAEEDSAATRFGGPNRKRKGNDDPKNA